MPTAAAGCCCLCLLALIKEAPVASVFQVWLQRQRLNDPLDGRLSTRFRFSLLVTTCYPARSYDLRAIQGLPEAEKLRRSSTLHPHTCWTPSSRGVQFQDSLLLGLPSSSRLTLHSRSPSAIIWCTCLNWAWPISLTGFMLVYATVLRTVSDVCLSHMQTSDSRRLGLLSTNVCTQFKLKCRPRSKSRSATMSCGFDCSHCSDSHLQHDKTCPLLFDRCACNP